MVTSTLCILKKALNGSRLMINIHLLTFLTAFFIFCMTVTNVYAAAILAKSCSLIDVQNAINSANRGDTVTVPTGSCIWTGTLSIDKAITLQGAGMDKTIIKAGFTADKNSSTYKNFMLYYNPSNISEDSNVILRITGLTFDQDYRAGGIYIRNISLTPLSKLIIDNNNISNSWDGDSVNWNYISAIWTYGTIYGVIHNNIISGQPHLQHFAWFAQTWNNKTYTHGNANTIYFEDNEVNSIGIRNVDNTSRSWWLDNEGGATVVYRYNTFISYRPDSWSDWYNPHGNKGSVYASMGGEVYGNYLVHKEGSASNFNLFGMRGGKNLVFYNKVYAKGSNGTRLMEREGSGLGADTTSPTNHTCPSGTLYAGTKSCASDGQPQHIWRTYIWNNRVGTSGTGKIISPSLWVGISPEKALRVNTDYFLDDTSFDGQSGVGCGTIAERPKTCATGVGYWATDQSCSEIPSGSYGKNPTSQLSGTLYRCTSANSWAAYYTPYTYPHPLRSGDEDSVSAPKGFKLVN